MTQPKRKQPAAFRLSGDCIALIKRAAKWLGVSQASVVEMAVRDFARKRVGKK